MSSEIASALADEFLKKYIIGSYGQPGVRIWGALKDKHLMEERDVAKDVLIPEKEARAVLLKMLRDDMVVMQEVPKTTEAAVLRTYYLYGVEETRAFRSLYLRTCKMLQNTLCRQHQVRLDCVSLADQAKATGLEEDQEHLQDAQKQYEALMAQVSLLLDDLILCESPLHQKLVQMKPERPKRGVKKKSKKGGDDDDDE